MGARPIARLGPVVEQVERFQECSRWSRHRPACNQFRGGPLTSQSERQYLMESFPLRSPLAIERPFRKGAQA